MRNLEIKKFQEIPTFTYKGRIFTHEQLSQIAGIDWQQVSENNIKIEHPLVTIKGRLPSQKTQ